MGVLANCRCVTFGCMVGFCLLLGGVGGTTTVTATAGQDVTLPCSYDAVYYGRLALCWGRGPIPNSGCNSEVLKADSRSVVSRQSERYRLMGDLNRGDVSLTILQVQLSESGIYGCRVDIPGWFNDHKHETTLSVVAGETERKVRAEDLHGDKVHPAVVAVPVLIIVAAIALGVTWRIRRLSVNVWPADSPAGFAPSTSKRNHIQRRRRKEAKAQSLPHDNG
ncbi:unnamed protein product [Merluccius merluccius]